MNTGAGQRLHRGHLLLPGQLPLLPGDECAWWQRAGQLPGLKTRRLDWFYFFKALIRLFQHFQKHFHLLLPNRLLLTSTSIEKKRITTFQYNEQYTLIRFSLFIFLRKLFALFFKNSFLFTKFLKATPYSNTSRESDKCFPEYNFDKDFSKWIFI